MHEMALCESILELIEEQARAQRFTRVSAVALEVGRLAAVEIEALRFGFDVVMRGSLAEKARLEIIETEGLIEAAADKGAHFLNGLQAIAAAHPGLVTNARGRGLFLAVDLPTRTARDWAVDDLRETEHVIVLPCGERSVRFRPALTVSHDEIDEAVAALARTVSRTLKENQ